MTDRKAYRDTSVPEHRSKAQIEDLLVKHGAQAVRWTSFAEGILLEFRVPEAAFGIRVAYEMGDAPRADQRHRQVVRALHWLVKSRLESVDFGVEETVLKAFLPYVQVGPGRILYDEIEEARVEGRLRPGVMDIPLLTDGWGGG